MLPAPPAWRKLVALGKGGDTHLVQNRKYGRLRALQEVHSHQAERMRGQCTEHLLIHLTDLENNP